MVTDDKADQAKKPLTPRNKKQELFNSIQDVKDLIIWAKSIGLKSIKVGDIEAEMSDIARALEATNTDDPELPKREELETMRTWADEAKTEPKNDEEELFWSSGS
jgi:hypothetical protein